MNVEDIEVLPLRDPEHLRGEGDGIGRIFEERILEDRDKVDVDILGVNPLDCDGSLVGDEMDLMAPLSELDAEAGSEDAAAPHGGITGDSDLHSAVLPLLWIRKAWFKHDKKGMVEA